MRLRTNRQNFCTEPTVAKFQAVKGMGEFAETLRSYLETLTRLRQQGASEASIRDAFI
jgi:hypothetical protein